MDFIRAIILGIIEGITEWLPISSTGHLIIADEFIRLNQSAAFKEMFDVVIQLGAILSVVVLYFHKLNPFNKLNPADKQKTPREIQLTWRLWLKVLIAALPAAIIGLPLNDLLVACIVAFGVSMVAIKFLTDYVKKHDFTFFGKYRIVLGIILLIYAMFKAFLG